MTEVERVQNTRVSVGDTVSARRRQGELVYDVVEVIEKRVSAARAAECRIDRSPPPPARSSDPLVAPAGGDRQRGDGRPTKRDRRRIDQLRGRR